MIFLLVYTLKKNTFIYKCYNTGTQMVQITSRKLLPLYYMYMKSFGVDIVVKTEQGGLVLDYRARELYDDKLIL